MENEHKTIANKQLITMTLKADAWNDTDKEGIKKQIVKDVFVTDENAQVYYGSDRADSMFADEESKTNATQLFDKLTRLVTWNGYIEAYIDLSDIDIAVIDIPITIMQDRNERKIEANQDKEKNK